MPACPKGREKLCKRKGDAGICYNSYFSQNPRSKAQNSIHHSYPSSNFIFKLATFSLLYYCNTTFGIFISHHCIHCLEVLNFLQTAYSSTSAMQVILQSLFFPKKTLLWNISNTKLLDMLIEHRNPNNFRTCAHLCTKDPKGCYTNHVVVTCNHIIRLIPKIK